MAICFFSRKIDLAASISLRHMMFIVVAAALISALSTPLAEAQSKQSVFCPANPELSALRAELLDGLRQVRSGKPGASVIRKDLSFAVRQDRLQCLIGAKEITDDLLEACRAQGLSIEGIYQSPGLNQLVVRTMDIAPLAALASHPDVRVILPEPRAITRAGLTPNQSDASIHADKARGFFGADGRGVRVGVLSDSLSDTLGGTVADSILRNASPQMSGDLPEEIYAPDPGPGGGEDEGAAMMELIYDLAPQCDFSFASAFTSYAAFSENIELLWTDPQFPCDIVVDDVIYFAEPIYQDGPIALAADAAAKAGVPYFSSAGNDSDLAHERQYIDINPGQDDMLYPPTGQDFHNFGAASGQDSQAWLTIRMESNAFLFASLHWDEPYGGGAAAGPGAMSDLDIYLTSSTDLPLTEPGNILTRSISFQGTPDQPDGDPYEVLQYRNSGSSAETVYLMIDHYAGREPVLLRLWFSLSNGVRIQEPGYLGDRTVHGHAAAEDALAVAACHYIELDQNGAFFEPDDTINVSPFSSLGGNLPILFSSGGIRLDEPQTRFKPEITGPNASNTSFFGRDVDYDNDNFPNFFGTSASAPHAAAVAALMLQLRPDLSSRDLYSALQLSAGDIEQPGKDFLSGAGIINAFRALQTIASPRLYLLDGFGGVYTTGSVIQSKPAGKK
jgi:hypothetical protein